MADELDPRLETSLRKALHAEADQLPLLIRSDDIKRARRRRRGKRLALPASLLGFAAVLAILVATGAIGRDHDGKVAASPSPSATPRALASYEDLGQLLDRAPVDLLRGEHAEADPGGEPVSIELGAVSGLATLDYAVHCLGGSIDLVAKVKGNELGTLRINCNIKPFDGTLLLSLTGEAPEGPVALTATSAPEVRWRIVVSTVPEATPSATPDPGLASYADLERILVDTAPSMPMVARGEQVTFSVAAGTAIVGAGSVGPFDFLNVALDCRGGDYSLAVMDGEAVQFGTSGTCGTRPLVWTDGAGSSAKVNRIVVTADASMRWRLVASGSGSSITPLAAHPLDDVLSYEELARYAESTLELFRAEHEAVDAPTQTVAGNAGAAWNLEIAVACDVGDVVVSFRRAGVAYPTTDTDAGTFGCDQGGTSALLALPGPAPDTQVVVNAPAGTSWRLIAYDHDAIPSP